MAGMPTCGAQCGGWMRKPGGNYWSDGFKVAYRNHLNFYNDDKNPSDVEQDRLAVSTLVDRLLAAAAQNPPPPAG